MKVTQNNNKPYFGMALHMPSSAKIQEQLGSYAAKQAEKARPRLEKISRNVDLTVTPIDYADMYASEYKGFAIKATKPTQDIKNPIKKCFTFICNILKPAEEISATATNLSQKLVQTAKKQIKKIDK